MKSNLIIKNKITQNKKSNITLDVIRSLIKSVMFNGNISSETILQILSMLSNVFHQHRLMKFRVRLHNLMRKYDKKGNTDEIMSEIEKMFD